MSANPVRWLKWSPLALVPFLGAWWFAGPGLERNLQESAVSVAKSGGLDWARIEMSGRDAMISGEAPDEAAITAAIQAVDGTYGIRRTISLASVAPPPPPPPPAPPEPEPLTPPTVTSILTNKAQPEILGTWPENNAKTLKVTVAERAFSLGEDPELASDGAGNWKLVPAAPMADGQYDIGVEVSDGVGRTATIETPGKLTVDTVAPTEPTVNPVVAQSSPDRITGTWPEGDAVSLKLSLAGQGYELGRSDRLTSDGEGNWGLALPDPLPEGRHDVAIDIADAAGNALSRQFASTIEVDSTPPANPTVTTFRGTASPEKIVGTWAEGDAVSLTVKIGENAHTIGTSPALTSDGKGNWSLALSSPLAPGKYDLSVETADRAMNISRTASPGAIDIVPPLVAPTVDPQAGNDPKPQLRGTFDQDRTKKLTVTLGSKTYELGRDNALNAPERGRWLLSVEALSDGTYDVQVEATDDYGNIARDTTTGELTIDTTPPTAPTIDRKLSNSRTPRIAGTWAEGDAADLSVSIGGKTYRRAGTPALTIEPQGRWSAAVEPLADGYYDVVAASADRFGNESRDATVAEVIIDTTPPAAPTVDKYAGNDATPELSGTWPAGDAKSLSLRIGGKTYVLGTDVELSAGQDGTWKLAINEPLPDGYYDVVATAKDEAGNESRDTSVAEVVIDTTPPAAPTVDKYAGNDSTPEISGTWPAGDAKSLSLRIGGKTYVLGTDVELSAGKDGTWRIAISEPLSDGYYDVVANAKDEAGNESRDTSVVEVIIDTTPPAVPTVNAGSGLPVTGSFAPGDTKTLTVTLADKTYELGKAPELTATDEIWSLVPPGELLPGTYDIVVTAADEFGNVATDASAGELVIAGETPPPSPPEPPAPSPPPEPAVEMAVPTVESQIALVARPKLTGTWAEGIAKTLKVTIDGEDYVLGQSERLSSDGAGRWTLSLERPLRDGIYEVDVETTDPVGTAKTDRTRDELIVDAAPPATPTVRLSATELSPASVSGTWAEGDANSLVVGLEGVTSVLGADRALRSDGSGNWTLALNRTLDPGSYDVVVTTKDGRGRISSDQTKFEIFVKGVEEATPVPDTAPIDCQSEFNTLLTVQGIRFGSDTALLDDASLATIAKLAAVAASCPDKMIEIGGHTDSTGSAEYNLALSEHRAVAVRDTMMAAGADGQRLIAKGYGETSPLANNGTEQGRMVNRRIEFMILN